MQPQPRNAPPSARAANALVPQQRELVAGQQRRRAEKRPQLEPPGGISRGQPRLSEITRDCPSRGRSLTGVAGESMCWRCVGAMAFARSRRYLGGISAISRRHLGEISPSELEHGIVRHAQLRG